MFLKSLTIKGFKSFAEETTLEFEPGITVVVGPNGSGKSNIVDAVAWVLGAQAPRAVRSAKMEDVIFAGSASRPALGRAEVSLTIDNSARLLPIDFTEVTVTRTLFRSSGESEYAINGVACRLLDVQELLSDTGVGRQQHLIVSQGNLDAILNARPEERRLVVEEAAGVLKHRRRKEKAERRLEATEANLVRLQDLVREVRRQLRPLERQAEAARRHGEVAAELSTIRRYLAGSQLVSLRGEVAASASTHTDLASQEAPLRRELTALDTLITEAEAALSAVSGLGGLGGKTDLSELVSRYERAKERARGLGALLAERRRSVARHRDSTLAADLVASLEADAARTDKELAIVDTETVGLLSQLDELAVTESALADERAAFEASKKDDEPEDGEAASGAAELRGERTAVRASVERSRTELGRVEARLATLGDQANRKEAEEQRLLAEMSELRQAEAPLVADVEAATERHAAGEQRLAEVTAALAAVTQERHTWAARADALTLAIEAARARAGAAAKLLAESEVDGVVGNLWELVEVDQGWESAFEAAAGEALDAVVMANPAAARSALALLNAEATPGAVIALGTWLAEGDEGPEGTMGAAIAVAPLVGGKPVRTHVRAKSSDVDALLDVLLAGAVMVNGLDDDSDTWEYAIDVALAHPGLVVVTRDGHRFSARGWRLGANSGAGAGGGTGGGDEAGVNGATGMALDQATREVEAADRAIAAAQDQLWVAREERSALTHAAAAATRARDEHRRRLAAAADALRRLEAERSNLATDATGQQAHRDELALRVERDTDRLAELDAILPTLEAAEAAQAERRTARQIAQARLDGRAAAITTLRTELDIRAAGLEERRALLSRRRVEIDERLAANVAERAAGAARRHELDLVLARTDRLAALIDEHLATIDAQLTGLRQRWRAQTERAKATASRLERLRTERAATEHRLEQVREQVRRAELAEAEARLRLDAAVEAVRRDLDCEPEAVLAAACPELPPGTTAPNRARELERELRLMGPINPLAIEELSTLEERHRFLEDQIDDIKTSRRELRKIIRAIDDEITTVVRAAYADVSENYTRLFETLFPGGSGQLRLTDPDNLLETGIELEARPPGKTLRRLSLLSGGERSLVALAFLFAVFRSRPSPFYLLDEVEAALDDVNLHRFLDLLRQFRDEAQLLVVSHQKRTMEAADCLYGVTMRADGATRVVSERVARTAS